MDNMPPGKARYEEVKKRVLESGVTFEEFLDHVKPIPLEYIATQLGVYEPELTEMPDPAAIRARAIASLSDSPPDSGIETLIASIQKLAIRHSVGPAPAADMLYKELLRQRHVRNALIVKVIWEILSGVKAPSGESEVESTPSDPSV